MQGWKESLTEAESEAGFLDGPPSRPIRGRGGSFRGARGGPRVRGRGGGRSRKAGFGRGSARVGRNRQAHDGPQPALQVSTRALEALSRDYTPGTADEEGDMDTTPAGAGSNTSQ